MALSNPDKNTPPSKNDRIQLRVSERKKKIIAQAAKVQDKTISEFIIDRAFEEAQNVLAEQNHFFLPEDKWNAYNHALEAPVRELPALKKLLEEPTIFTEE